MRRCEFPLFWSLAFFDMFFFSIFAHMVIETHKRMNKKEKKARVRGVMTSLWSISFLLSFCLCMQAQTPLPIDATHSFETEQLHYIPERSESLPITSFLSGWRHHGLGTMTYVDEGQLRLCLPVHTGQRAQGSPDDPDYATFGRATVSFELNGRNLEDYDRITMDVYPQCQGVAIMNLNLYLNQIGNESLGAHLVNLKNNQWNKVVYLISGLRRDQSRCLDIYTDLKGRNHAQCDSFTYLIKNIRLEQVGHSEKETGWCPSPGCIAHSFSGYFTRGQKTAVVNLSDLSQSSSFSGCPFQLVRADNGTVVFDGIVQEKETTLGTFGILDFSSFSEAGDYQLACLGMKTGTFHIGDDAFRHAEELLLNFIYCQRCGYAVPGIHGVCHSDVFCSFNGKQVSYGGGWHDAGDLSQQTMQTCETAYALLEAWQKMADKDAGLASRLMDEATWGLRFVLRCRLGDGYHASSIGLLHWTDGIVGTEDDIFTVRRQNVAYDNFLYAACEAYAARIMPPSSLRDSLATAAVEDFQFAIEKWEKEGHDPFPHIFEHTYNTSYSQYHATISWAASQLFMLTGKKEYGETAAHHIGYVLECQEEDGVCPGYFYRDKTRRSIVHYIHQSREQLFMQALTGLCESQPKHQDYGRWLRSIQLYGNYLKRIITYTAPYQMAPSGIYQTEEYADSAGFHSLHIFSPDNAYERYDIQLKKGVKMDDNHYLRRFPIWFNIFNGNEAILLSTGKAAALCGHFLNDDDLMQIGREQLYWTVGKNPFCQSLIYGEGRRYPSMDSFSSGEIMGEIPVGIRSLGDEDIPYWPHTNNACYKEVWVTSAAKFLSLLAEY